MFSGAVNALLSKAMLKSSEVVSWPADPASLKRVGAERCCTLQLSSLNLPPNWYRLSVWVEGNSIRVSARAGFNQSRADLRMHLEARGHHRLEKIFKVSEPMASLSVIADGGKGAPRIDRVEIRPMRRASIFAFLAAKGVRYLICNRNRLDWIQAWKHFRAALRPRASFVFQSRYGRRGDEAAYARWRLLHENAGGLDHISQDLRRKLGDGTVRIALILGDDIDEREARRTAQSLVADPGAVRIVPVRAGDLAGHKANDPEAVDREADDREADDREAWDFALIFDRKGAFATLAVERMLLALLEDDDIQAVFADSDVLGADGGRQGPLLKPPLWDRELLWSTDYIKSPLMLRWTPKIRDVLAWPGATRLPSYALALMMSGACHRRQLKHIPAILFHEQGESAAGAQQLELTLLNRHLEAIQHPRRAAPRSGARRVAWPLSAAATVSIIIPSKDNPGLLGTCVESIRDVTIGVEPEIIVADNGSVKPETKAYLRRLELTGTATVIPCPGPFNFSRINNDARRHAAGSILVFLNDDTRIVSPDWLVELASMAARPEIGAVGGLLLYPDGTVQHAGVLLGIRGIADHAFRHESGDAAGYMDLLRCRREVSAVTGACLAVSAAHFDSVAGFDETLAVTANDMDLCLRLRARGLINIWSPWCVVEHAESKSRGVDSTDAALERQGQETLVFTRRWGHLLDCDPTYNPGLSRIAPDYSLRVE